MALLASPAAPTGAPLPSKAKHVQVDRADNYFSDANAQHALRHRSTGMPGRRGACRIPPPLSRHRWLLPAIRSTHPPRRPSPCRTAR